MECNKKDILAALRRVNMVVPKRSNLPILTQAIFSLGVDTLEIRATDLTSYLRARVPVENPSTFTTWEIVADSRLIEKMVKSLPDRITMDYVETSHEGYNEKFLEINGQRVNLSILPEDFPVFPENEKTIWEGQVTHDQLTHSLSGSYAASWDEARFNLNCIKWEPGLFVATDGHRLSRRAADWYQGPAVLFPIQAAESLPKLLPDEFTVRIEDTNPRYAYFIGDGFKLSVRMIEGDFPDYQRVIPSDDKLNREFLVERKPLLDAIKSLEPYWQYDKKRVNRGVTLTLNGGLSLEMTHPDRGTGKATVPITGRNCGEGWLSDVNLHYLRDAVQASAPIVRIKFDGRKFKKFHRGAYVLNSDLLMPVQKDDTPYPEIELLPWQEFPEHVSKGSYSTTPQSPPRKGKGAGRAKKRVEISENAPQEISVDSEPEEPSPQAEEITITAGDNLPIRGPISDDLAALVDSIVSVPYGPNPYLSYLDTVDAPVTWGSSVPTAMMSASEAETKFTSFFTPDDARSAEAWGLAVCRRLRKRGAQRVAECKKLGLEPSTTGRSLKLGKLLFNAAFRGTKKSPAWYIAAAYGFLQGR